MSTTEKTTPGPERELRELRARGESGRVLREVFDIRLDQPECDGAEERVRGFQGM